MAIQILDIQIEPNPLVAGKTVKVTCKVESSEEIQSVHVYDPRDWMLKMYDDGTHGDDTAGDGIYTLTETVPYDAPPGAYYSTLIVRDTKSNVERKSVQLQVS